MTNRRNGNEAGEGAGLLEQLHLVEPGDVVDVWMETAYVIRSIFLCEEGFGPDVTRWRWIFLDDGSLVEASPDGCYRYRRHELVRQGTDLYEELVAPDGVLVRFEQRVREGSAGRRPVHVTLGGTEYRVASTGTARVQHKGDPPDLLPWQSFSSDPEKNVYFGLVAGDDGGDVVLGLWTAHVSLSFGAELPESQISGVYRKK